jgi:hypothetical protein
LDTIPNNNSEELEKTEVIYGLQNAIRKIFGDSYHRINEKLDTCVDSNGPCEIISTKSIKDALFELTIRGVKIRCIAEITKENVGFTEEIDSIIEMFAI